MTADTHRQRNPRGEGERLRAELVTAASGLLETLPGQEALSLRAVARTAGVSAPSVYLHFADKSALVAAVLQERFDELRAALDAAAVGVDAPRDELVARCIAYCSFADAHPGHYRVMFTAVPAASPETTVGPRAIEDLPGADIVAGLGDVVARCAPGGPAGDDPLPLAVLLWCGLHGIVALRASKPAFPWPERDTLVACLVAGIVGPGPSPTGG